MRIALTSFILLFVSQFVLANSLLNSQTVTVNFKNTSLSEIVWEIRKQTELKFVYSSSDLEKVVVNEVNSKDTPVEEVLNCCLDGTDLEYEEVDGVVIIKKQAKRVVPQTTQQNVTLKGTVVDDYGEPIIGVHVVVKGTQNGASTDLDGHFSLNVKENKPTVVTFSFIGLKSREVKMTPGKLEKIVLQDDQTLLEEVVVTGYGTFKKSAYAGSASFVKGEESKDLPSISMQQMLEGATPGLQITSNSGVPGAVSSVQIRGMGSFNASNSPLYVIDGVPVMSGNIASTSTESGLDVMATINTSDIDNITVIKDAAAASLYGSRAANGVIIINTKKGKKGKPSFTFKSDWGFSKFAMDFREMMGGQERRDVIYEGLENQARLYEGKPSSNGLHSDMTDEEIKAFADSQIDEYAPVPWNGFVDWTDHLFQTGKRSNYEFSASGASDKMRYYTSIGYMDQEGVAKNSGIERLTGRMNVDYDMTNRLKVGANILFSKVNQDSYSEGSGYNAPIYGTRNGTTPSDPIWLEDGSWNEDLIKLDNRNPMQSRMYNSKREYVTRSFNTVFASLDLYKNLVLKSTFSYDFIYSKGKTWYDPRTSDGGGGKNGSFSKRMNERTKLNWSTIMSYSHTFVDKHNLDVLVGYEIEQRDTDYLSASKHNFANPGKVDINTGMKERGSSGSMSENRMVSYITRANYDYLSKYYLGASWRTDGSSRLDRKNRWGHFWSISGAWRISAEPFMAGASDWLTDLKLRLSYGVNGTLPSGNYPYQPLSSLTSSYDDQPGVSQTQMANRDLTWESNNNLNLGIDASFFNSRLNITLEYYRRVTNDLIYARPLSITTGFSSYLSNIGKLRNQGFEVEINTRNIKNKNFTWNTSLNLYRNSNKVLRLDGELENVISGSFIRKVGKPYRTFYLIEFAGIDKQTGLPQFYSNTRDENGVLQKDLVDDPNDAERIEYGHADPTITGALGNFFTYKWFDLGFNFNFSFGGKSYDSGASKMEHGGDGKLNIPKYYRKRWQEEGDDTSIERFILNRNLSMNSYRTTRRIHSRDFIRLKSLTFGATLPKKWTNPMGIDRIRFFASGNNLLTWASYKEYDPEIGHSVGWSTPPLRTLTFGIEVKF